MQLADGAYGTLLQPHLRSGETVDDLCSREPARIVDAHLMYLHAGARQIQTNSFLAWRRADVRRRAIYLSALDCAREATATAGGSPGVIGTIGPAGAQPRDFYRDLELLLDAQVDSVVCETVTDSAVAEAFCRAWKEVAVGVGVIGRLHLSVSPSLGAASWKWLSTFDDHSASLVLGLNCCEGPEGLREPLQRLNERSETVSVLPSAGLPERALAPEPWSEAVAELCTQVQVDLVGGCCQTTPAHVSALATAF